MESQAKITSAELLAFVEKKIINYANNIINLDDAHDNSALGELMVYLNLRNILKGGKGDMQAHGMLDAIDDILEKMGLIEKTKGIKFYQLCKK